MKSTSRERNALIEILRFVAGISIAAFHFEWIYIGHPVYLEHFYIWVEFFFVVSGFFLVIQAENYEEKIGLKYVFKQLKKLYPLYFLAFLFSFVITCLTQEIPLNQWIGLLWNAKWEVLLCSMFGFDNASVIYNRGGAAGYIPTLLICSGVIYYLVKNYRDLFINIIGPVIIIGGLGRIINLYGNLSQWMAFDGWFNVGIIRGMADISVGAWFALVVMPVIRVREDNNEKTIKGLGFVLPIGTIVMLIGARSYISYSDLIFFIFVFGFIISILYVVPVKWNNNIKKIGIYLGGLSYPIFLFHFGLLQIMLYFTPSLGYQGICVFLFLILILATVVLKIKKITNIL